MQFDQLNSARSSGLSSVPRSWPLAVRVCLIAVALAFAFVPIVHAADSSGKGSSSALWAAVITGAVTMIGLILQLGYNAREARRVEKTKAEEEQKQRQRELALKIVDLVGKDRAAARRFAIGLVKVEKVGNTPDQNEKSSVRGQVYFIPVNSRFSVGRDEENDIHLHDPNLPDDLNRELSRYQCGFVSDQQHVVVEDFNSRNGTFVNDPSGNESIDLEGMTVKFARVRRRMLADGDRIWVRPFVLRFVKLQENKILL
jgi:FHA domain